MKLPHLLLISALQAISLSGEAAGQYYCVNVDLICDSGTRKRVTGIGPTKESAENDAEKKFGKVCHGGGRVEWRAPCKRSNMKSFYFETEEEEE
jgi:hypothetical protein